MLFGKQASFCERKQNLVGQFLWLAYYTMTRETGTGID